MISPVFTVAKMRSLIRWSLLWCNSEFSESDITKREEIYLFIPDRERHRLDANQSRFSALINALRRVKDAQRATVMIESNAIPLVVEIFRESCNKYCYLWSAVMQLVMDVQYSLEDSSSSGDGDSQEWPILNDVDVSANRWTVMMESTTPCATVQ